MNARRIGLAWRSLRLAEFALAREACAACSWPIQVRLSRDEMGVRCLRCGASAVTQSLVAVLRELVPDLGSRDAYELSSVGPLVRFLTQTCRTLRTSEFIPGLAPGASLDGVMCQDVERLTFPAEAFDLCTATEVFEHVADDAAGFSEIHRVLRPGGWFVFTVPISDRGETVERTALVDDRRVPTLPPEYHADRIRGPNVFCYRNYGTDIVERLRGAGFGRAELRRPGASLFGCARTVAVAQKLTRPGAV